MAYQDILRWLNSRETDPTNQEIMEHFGWSQITLDHEMFPLVKNKWVTRSRDASEPPGDYCITYEGRKAVEFLDEHKPASKAKH